MREGGWGVGGGGGRVDDREREKGECLWWCVCGGEGGDCDEGKRES